MASVQLEYFLISVMALQYSDLTCLTLNEDEKQRKGIPNWPMPDIKELQGHLGEHKVNG